jgi:hypothetical protein
VLKTKFFLLWLGGGKVEMCVAIEWRGELGLGSCEVVNSL